MASPFTLTHREMNRRLKERTPTARLLTKFVNSKDTPTLQAFCTKHKETYTVTAKGVRIYKAEQCPSCKTENKRASVALSHSDVVKRIAKAYPHIEVTGTYVNSGTPIAAICTKHSLKFKLNLNNALYNGYANCPSCRFENSFFNTGKGRSSAIAEDWIKHAAKQLGFQYRAVRTANNGGEVFLEGIGFVDGFHARSGTVFEFHGNDWHGCPKKHKDRDAVFFGQTYGERYAKTKAKERAIRKAGYSLVVMWEANWMKKI